MSRGVVLDLMWLFLYCGVIYFLSDRPAIEMPMLFSHQDKLHHFLAYGIMGWLAWRTFAHRLNGSDLFFVSLIFCSLYGVSDEFHQSFVPGRDADGLDWLADSFGALAVISMLVLNQTRQAVNKDKDVFQTQR